MTLKVLTVVGTRPEGIKLAPVIRALLDTPMVESRVCATGQHRGLLDQVLQAFGVVPDHDLDVMRPGQTLAGVAARVLERLEPVLLQERPDWVLVQGDTTTAAMASLCAFYCGIRVGHVEAGLRTFDRRQPFPEEVNRRLTAVVADLHFAPTEHARRNLVREGVPPEDVLVTGNTVIDALRTASRAHQAPAEVLAGVPPERRTILVTMHRRESFGAPMREVCAALADIVRSHPDVHLVLPVHPNPQVSGVVHELLGALERVTLCPPLDYLSLVQVLQRAYAVVTDSGGLQEEAPGLGKPVLVVRDTTERPEAVEAGTARLIGTGRLRVRAELARLLDDEAHYLSMARAVNPFGDGKAAPRIVQALLASPPTPSIAATARA